MGFCHPGAFQWENHSHVLHHKIHKKQYIAWRRNQNLNNRCKTQYCRTFYFNCNIMLTAKQLRFENCTRWSPDSSDSHTSLLLYKASRLKKKKPKPNKTQLNQSKQTKKKIKTTKKPAKQRKQQQQKNIIRGETFKGLLLFTKGWQFFPRNAFCNLKPLHPKLYTGPQQNEHVTVTK